MDKFEQNVIKMYNEEDKSTYQIANALNTYPNKIRRILIKNGIDLKDRSEAQKVALSSGRSSHPTEGKVRTHEERLRISSGLVDYWDKMTDKEKKRRTKMAQDNWKNMSALSKENMRARGIAAIREAAATGSKLETFFYDRLLEAGFDVKRHVVIIPAENLEIDLYIPSLKAIIEVDGPSHFYPIWGEDKLNKQINADLRKSGALLSRNYLIIRIKSQGNESLSKKEDLIRQILETLNSIKLKFPPKSKRFIEVE